jgi:gliding motility-associated-like protein
MKPIHLLTLLQFLCMAAIAQPELVWQRAFGGTDFDVPSVLKPTADGGLIIGSTSFSNDGDAAGNHGADDILIIKLKADRSVDWKKLYGGSDEDGLHDLQPTTDGGYILAGFTKSNDGDITGLRGQADFWVIKIDQLGAIQWQHTYGGRGSEVASSVRQTPDGGFIVAGYTVSNDGQVTNNHGPGTQDAWVIKLDNTGNLQWQRCYGGTDADFAYDIELVAGGYVFAGYARSADGDLPVNKGLQDVWTVRLDLAGSIQWQTVLGGSRNEHARKVAATSDGGFLITAVTSSSDADITGQHGATDGWLIKLKADGTVQWKRCYGGSSLESLQVTLPLAGAGFYVIGSSESTDHDVSGNHGKSDYWILNLDNSGGIVWQKNLGGTNIDDGFAATVLTDGQLVVAGTSFSRDTDVKDWKDAGDIWLALLTDKLPLPVVTQQPVDTATCAGTTASFSVKESNTTTFQWQVSTNNGWANIANDNSYSGTNTTTLFITSNAGLNGTQYRCLLINPYGQVISAAAKLTVLKAPSFTIQPASVSVCLGSEVKLTVTANDAASYQWQQANGALWQNMANATNARQAVIVNNDNQQYRAVATNGCGSATSNAAIINSRNCAIPNAFSPNGDQVNDHWNLPLLRNQPNCSVLVFDRYGNKIFESRGYTNSWDGISGGKPVPVGAYYYLIDLRDGSKPLSGSVTILR